jgi:hypothetical protein
MHRPAVFLVGTGMALAGLLCNHATGTMPGNGPDAGVDLTRVTPVAASLASYRTSGLTPRPGGSRLYAGTTTPRVDIEVHDATGARMVVVAGRTYNHPVGLAQYGLVNLTTYTRTHDVFYLNRAKVQANRLVSLRVYSSGAWFFHHDYPWSHSGVAADALRPPWYSAMAQGLATAFFCRMYTVTGDTAWLSAATRAFTALTHGPSSAAPWVSRVDSNAYLWLEEYPLLPASRSDRTLNGFMFALNGVYEYWLVTGSSTAARLFDGGVTTIAHHMSAYRIPTWISRYCLAHPWMRNPRYHPIHERLLLVLYTMTHRSSLAADADLLRYDYPLPTVSGVVRFAAGLHTGYRFTAAGSVLASRTIRLASASQAPANQRARIFGRGIYYRVTAGSFAGYWVPESPPSRALQGIYLPHVYVPVRSARLAAGTYTGYRFGSGGQILSHSTRTIPASAAASSRSAWVNGRPYALITQGTFAGTWLALNRHVVLV